MTWDDSGNAFLHGMGPTLAVIDPLGVPNNMLDEAVGGTCDVKWSFGGPGRIFLGPTVFTVNLYAGAIGPGPDKLVGSVNVLGTAHVVSGPDWDFTATIPIAPGALPANGPGVSGVYRLTTVITNSVLGVKDFIAGFVDGPVIEIHTP